ncbi:hypothetical protein GH714_000423 [Hevea brasiliensis]|uniref:Uncharacterized protein n=1 Tax=Hevea brasiliensis TaxID=3981 RepID=A0A6A6LU13_HEVBR|nr:hypothetical protein GH714_000423 [Hevea brasiliensis]
MERKEDAINLEGFDAGLASVLKSPECLPGWVAFQMAQFQCRPSFMWGNDEHCFTASDIMQDFKTGYVTLSSPRSMYTGTARFTP